jgi:excisionase family DNA binding protein
MRFDMKARVLEDDFYTVQEVADKLRVSYQTVVREIRSGAMPGAKVGGQWRVSDSALRGYLEARAAFSPALREPPQMATQRGRPRRRRAPLRPRVKVILTEEVLST